jgi:hypothetical protein
LSIIEKHVKTSQLTSTYTPFGILINGEPGLGKSRFGDFLATRSIVGNVYRLDMTTCLKDNFEDIFSRSFLYEEFTKPSVFILDEIDKYIEYYLANSYKILAAKKDEVHDEQTHYRQTTKDFLYSLLKLLERDNLRAPTVLIFCSNNFDTIFDRVDSRHFESLKSRFTMINFRRCDRREIGDYFRHYNRLFVNTEFNVDDAVLNDLINTIPSDASITYRSLHQLTTRKSFNFAKIVRALQKSSSIHSPAISPSSTPPPIAPIPMRRDELDDRLDKGKERIRDDVPSERISVGDEEKCEVCDKPMSENCRCILCKWCHKHIPSGIGCGACLKCEKCNVVTDGEYGLFCEQCLHVCEACGKRWLNDEDPDCSCPYCEDCEKYFVRPDGYEHDYVCPECYNPARERVYELSGRLCKKVRQQDMKEFLDLVNDNIVLFKGDHTVANTLSKIKTKSNYKYIENIMSRIKITPANRGVYDSVEQWRQDDNLANLQAITVNIINTLKKSDKIFGQEITELFLDFLSLDKTINAINQRAVEQPEPWATTKQNLINLLLGVDPNGNYGAIATKVLERFDVSCHAKCNE